MADSIGLVELKSIAKGILSADEMTKAGNVTLLQAMSLCPGKFIVVVSGNVSDVESAVSAGKIAGGESVIDSFVLPYVHRDVIPAIAGTTKIEKVKSIGVIETFSIASAVVAGDISAKTAEVKLIEIRLARGMGGKSYVTMTGETSDVQSAVDAGKKFAEKEGLLVSSVVIPNPTKDVIEKIL